MFKEKEIRIEPVKYVLMLLVLFLVFSSIPVDAGGEDALLGDVELTPTPSSQGEGGPITIDLAIPFYSGCCYPLYAYDVSASLALPRDMEIVSGPVPQKYSKVVAAAGGEPTWVHIQWVVKSMKAGDYTIDVTVESQNCGSTTGSTMVSVTEGCVMSIPDFYPKAPSTESAMYVNLEAMSPIPGVVIENVVLYYTNFDDERTGLRPKNETLFYKKDKSVSGTPLVMESIVDKENFFTVKIPKQGKATYVHYWVVAEDNAGKRTTSPVYAVKVEDMDYANFILGVAIFSPLILTGLCIFGMILLSRYFKRVDSKKEGLLVLGSDKVSQKEIPHDLKTLHKKRRNRALYLGFGILFSLGMILLIWGILSHQLDDLIYVVGGGL